MMYNLPTGVTINRTGFIFWSIVDN